MIIPWSQQEFEAARPPENITRSEWAYRNINLTNQSAIRGPYDINVTPHWKWPLDELLSMPSVEIIAICASAQIGKSYFTYLAAFHAMKEEKKSSLIVLADKGTADKVNERRLQKIVENSEKLLALKDKFTAKELAFLNGTGITVAWASSVAGLATFEYPIIILDETDKEGYKVKSDEADAVSLAIERTETFPGRKIILISTPSIITGNIWTHLEGIYNPDTERKEGGSDVIYDYHIPCPECGLYQPMRWDSAHAYGFDDNEFRGRDNLFHPLGQVVWEGGRKATQEQINRAGYECGECKDVWTTSQKNGLVDVGEWVPRKVIDYEPTKVGLHIWRAYSKLADSGDFSKMVRNWVSAVNTKDFKKIQGVVNSTMAGPFMVDLSASRNQAVITAQVIDVPKLLIPVNSGIVGLTCGIDTQDNCFYYVVRAWGRPRDGKLESWLIDNGIILTWKELTKLTEKLYQDRDGRDYYITLAMIDSQGHRVSEVYAWSRGKGNVRASQGVQKMAQPYSSSVMDIYPDTKKPIPGGLSLYSVNTTYYKDALFIRTNTPSGEPGASHIHSEVDESYKTQMIAEYREEETGIWRCPKWKPNHYLDCEVLALAASDISGLNKREINIEEWSPPKEEDEPPQDETVEEIIEQTRYNPYLGGRRNPYRRRG